MNAFVNGALSALEKLWLICEAEDPEHLDPSINKIREYISINEEVYTLMGSLRDKDTIEDEAGDKIKETEYFSSRNNKA